MYVFILYQKPTTSTILGDRSSASSTLDMQSSEQSFASVQLILEKDTKMGLEAQEFWVAKICVDKWGKWRSRQGELSDYSAERRQGRNNSIGRALDYSTFLRKILAKQNQKAKVAC